MGSHGYLASCRVAWDLQALTQDGIPIALNIAYLRQKLPERAFKFSSGLG
jgi:hypothetical protein